LDHSITAMNPVARNLQWFVQTGQMPETPTPDVRQSAFYIGMQCEELREKLAAIIGEDSEVLSGLKYLATHFKSGRGDEAVRVAFMSPKTVKAMLDGDLDLIWVSVGAARAQGADVQGGYGEVDTANEAKRFPDGEYHRHPETGKVLKPEGWQEPNLTPFIHESLREKA
jgi:predicted HAD superfamily Cof-like phosphohydrolase